MSDSLAWAAVSGFALVLLAVFGSVRVVWVLLERAHRAALALAVDDRDEALALAEHRGRLLKEQGLWAVRRAHGDAQAASLDQDLDDALARAGGDVERGVDELLRALEARGRPAAPAPRPTPGKPEPPAV